MATKSGDRESYFPLIEKKYGEPMSYWFKIMKDLKDEKYPVQIAHLKENYGFSQAHANAVVMYSRGSTSSKRFSTLDDYLKPFDEIKQKTVHSIFKAIKAKYPKIEIVIAWNQPMAKLGNDYLIGVTVLKNHILLGPWASEATKKFEKRLVDYKVNKKTIQVPVDWKVDKSLIQDLVAARVKEL